MEIEVFDVESLTPSPELRKPPRYGGLAIAGVCLAIVVGLQLIPSADPAAVEEIVAPEPTAPKAQPVVINSQFQWAQVGGLDRFDTVTKPVTTDSGYLAVGNPPGINGAASVLVSHDGSQWNRWGTIHGVGGDVVISDVERSSDQYLAFGSYTEEMPKTEFAMHERIPAVWSSENGIGWDMRDMSYTPLGVAISTRDSLAVIDIERLALNGSVDFFGASGDFVAVLQTTTTSMVSVRELGTRGDPFASRANETTQRLWITKDHVQWTSEVVRFERIAFVGDVDGKFLIRARSGHDPDKWSFWLVTP